MGMFDFVTGPMDLLSGIGSGMSSFAHPEDAYKEAERASQQGWREARGYQEPYANRGMEQYGNLNQGIKDMMGQYPNVNRGIQDLMNPAELESRFTSGYQTSPYAQQLLGLNRQAGMDAASSMGLMGSSGALSNIQQGAGNIVAQDRRQYLEDLMNNYFRGLGLSSSLYGGGLNLSQNIYNQGAQTGRDLGNQAIDMGNTIGQARYNQARAPGALFEKLLNTGVQAAGMFAGA